MRYFLTGLLFLTIFFAEAQNTIETITNDNSPYSRIGLGDFVEQNFSASASMGGLSASFQDPYYLNVQNPAASAFLKSTSYELGLNYRRSTLTDKVTNSKSNYGAINYLAIGFPLKNQVNELFDKRKKSPIAYGMHFALVPFTNVSYDVQTTRVVPNVGQTAYTYRGSGGTYKFIWGNSVSSKGFSVGANLGYLFGRVKSDRVIVLNDLKDYYQTRFLDNTTYRGFTWTLGTQYVYDFKKKGEKGKLEPSGKKIIFGLYGNSANSINTNVDGLYTRTSTTYFSSATGFPTDTIAKERINGIAGKGKIPGELSIGATYQNSTKMRVGFNYSMSAWSKYENDAKKETLKDASRFGVGVEYTPEANSYNKYGRRISYRLGLNSWTDPRNLNGKSVSFGFGLPLIMPRQQISFVNFGFEVGQLNGDAMNQNYFKTTLGLTFNDNSWFYKRRYN